MFDASKAFHLFKIGKNNLLFGPDGLDDRIPYEELTLWRFAYSIKEFCALTWNDRIILFGNADKLLTLLRDRQVNIREFDLEYFNVRKPDDELEEVITKIEGGYQLILSVSHYYDSVIMQLSDGDGEFLINLQAPLVVDGWKEEDLDMALSLTPFLAFSENDLPEVSNVIEAYTKEKEENQASYIRKKEHRLNLKLMMYMVLTPIVFWFFQSLDTDPEGISFNWLFWVIYIGGMIPYFIAINSVSREAKNL
jgi:hypothetical protein